MAFATSESVINIRASSNSDLQNELTECFKKLKETLAIMLECIDVKFNTSNNKTTTQRNSKYEKLSFINDD